MHKIEFISSQEMQAEEKLRQRALKAYECTSFEEANNLMADLTEDVLGGEAAGSLGVEGKSREALQSVFYDAGKKTTDNFSNSFDTQGNYSPEKETEFWEACDCEGPVAKEMIKKAIEAIDISDLTPEHIRELLNNVYFEDAIKLSIKTLRLNKRLDDEQLSVLEQKALALCIDPQEVRDILNRVIPHDDYYYNRIDRNEKVNDESILKFNNSESHEEDDLKVIEVSLRLANATWFAAQRHCAKKDGNTDRINPKKRGGVFNIPDSRHIKQFKEVMEDSELNDVDAVLRIAFELSKDSWMLED